MCILFLSVSKGNFTICSNRDEYTSRETASADENNFPNDSNLLAGKDLRAGGTWLGVNTLTGRFACILNVAPSETMPPNSPSRGFLPLSWLRSQSSQTPKQFMTELLASEENEQRKYAGFSLIIAAMQHNEEGTLLPQVVWGTNSYGQKRGQTMMASLHENERNGGIYSFTNDGRMYAGPNNSMEASFMYWPKARRGWDILSKIIQNQNTTRNNDNETDNKDDNKNDNKTDSKNGNRNDNDTNMLIHQLMEELLHCTNTNDIFTNVCIDKEQDTTLLSQEDVAKQVLAQQESDEWSEYVSRNRNLTDKKAEVPIFLEWSSYATRTSTILYYDTNGMKYVDQLYDGSNGNGNKRTMPIYSLKDPQDPECIEASKM